MILCCRNMGWRFAVTGSVFSVMIITVQGVPEINHALYLPERRFVFTERKIKRGKHCCGERRRLRLFSVITNNSDLIRFFYRYGFPGINFIDRGNDHAGIYGEKRDPAINVRIFLCLRNTFCARGHQIFNAHEK